MSEEKNLEYNKRYTWNEIAATYPDMYAFLAEPALKLLAKITVRDDLECFIAL